MQDFVTLSNIKISEHESQLALAQFTPRSRREFGFGEVNTNVEARLALERVNFSPCDVISDKERCRPRASINSLAGDVLQTGNRKRLPDVVVVISSTKYRIPEQLPTETLFSPQSPLHIFYVMIGGPSPDESRFEPSATFTRLSAVDFTALERLVVPLCETVNSFVGGTTQKAAFGATCWLVTGILAGVLLLCLLVFGYAVYAYRRESKVLSYRLKEMENKLRSQNEFFTAKLHTQMEEQIKAGERHAEELRKHNETIENMQVHQMELQRQQQLSTVPPPSIPQPQPIIIPYLPPNAAVSQQPPQLGIAPAGQLTYSQVSNDPRLQGNVLNGHVQGSQLAKQDSVLTGRGSNGNGSKREEELRLRLDKLEESIGNAKRQNEHGHGVQQGSQLNSSSVEQSWPNDPHSITEEDSSDGTTTDDSGYVAQGGKLPSNHPARHLPPVDILLLVDSSSSIGISNFEAVKANIINVLEDVDIGPGRSRVALVQYALQPSVVFGFDKYYSLKSVKKGVERMSYTGGATMLSKALSFAAGLLYKEQNMRDVKKRKHKLMPTPRHDRLQVLCLVSDGASDDNIDRAAAYLHEKLQIKIMAMVTRSFHKDRLVAVTRFEGSIFVMDQKESISIWLWRQQRMWAENYAAYIEREKSMPLSLKHSPKKNNRVEEQPSKSAKSL
ncbi:hypothetical protein RB195_014765 [Necator americanus]|uniref:VWFA domain-containing protein n=1 Tax=Necator americanus TaxID=51031 RepID=A0ABR1E1X6_NECAM